jgi:hypothetical protein
MEQKEFQFKAIQGAAELTKSQVETEGKELDNAQKQLELSQQVGGIQDLVRAEVQRMIVQAFQETQPNGGGSPGIR